MLRWLILLTLLVSFGIPTNSSAQTPIEFSKVLVDIRPEYDRRDVLVIYQISISAQAALPAKINLRIPKAAGEPFAVAMKDNNDLVNLVYTTSSDNDWVWISFTTPVPDIWVEYYDPRLNRTQDRRDFDFIWPGDYTVQNLTIQVQQPATASQMVLTPSLGSGRQGADGLVYYSAMEGKVNAGVSFTLKLAYEKANDSLTAPSQPVQPSAPIAQNESGQQNVETILWLALGIFGFLLMAIAAWWYFTSRRTPSSASRRRHSGKRVREQSMEENQADTFCHQCGKRAGPGDHFCRVCGTRLRE